MANRGGDLSSSLRGSGSLHSLLGRDVTRRRKPKPGNPGAGVGDQSAGVASAADAAGTSKSEDSSGDPACPAEPPAASGSAAARGRLSAPPPPLPAHPPRPGSPLQAGHVRCPVCSCQLPHDDAKVNAHIGEPVPALAPPAPACKVCVVLNARLNSNHAPLPPPLAGSTSADKCLSKGTVRTRTQQSTIFQFAVRPSTASLQIQQQPQPTPTRRRNSAGAAALAAGAASAAGDILSSAATVAAAAAAVAGAPVVDLAWEGKCHDEASTGTGAWPLQQQRHQPKQQPDAPHLPAASPVAVGVGTRTRHQQSAVQSPSVPSQSTPGTPLNPAQQGVKGPQHPQQQTQQQVGQQQQSNPRPQRTPLGSSPQKRQARVPAEQAGSLRCFSCSVVGRQYQKHDVTVQAGQVRQPRGTAAVAVAGVVLL
jgi:hypothetical protein